jgi:hypothetical protein
MDQHFVDGELMGYVAHLEGGGYCLCAADDLMLPVYFYSADGIYNEKNSDLHYFLEEISARTQYYRQGLEEKDPTLEPYRDELMGRSAYWQDLMVGLVPERGLDKGATAAPEQMVLDLTCTWSQGSPYNDDCPILQPESDEHSVVGCVATAMSQIMYYWKFPNSGEGGGSTDYQTFTQSGYNHRPLATNPSIPYAQPWGNLPDPPYDIDFRLLWNEDEWGEAGGNLWMTGFWDASLYESALALSTVTGYRNAISALWSSFTMHTTTYSVAFGSSTYDWSLINDTHSDLSPSAGDAEVARLCYNAGVAVEMDYGFKSSGAQSGDIGPALSDHFRYDPDVNLLTTANFNRVVAEIQWLRPVVLAGHRPSGGGHAFVGYGYNSTTGQLKMNMGWGGASDNWYTFSSMPTPVDFINNQKQVVFIAPENVVRFVDITGPGDGSPDSPHGSIQGAVGDAPDGATLIFKAGSDNTFDSDNLTLDYRDKELTLKGVDATIRRSY